MSNHVEALPANAVRSEDELEGALLPVATQVVEEPNTSNPAVPIATFDYDTAMAAERRQQQQQQQENIAYTIPQHGKASVADDSRERVKLAQSKGLVAAEEEKEAVRNTNRKVFAKDYFSEKAIQSANENGRMRDAQGLQISDIQRRVHPSTEIENRKEKDTQERKNSSYGVGGYQIKDYSIGSDYKTSDYEIGEYKSIYD